MKKARGAVVLGGGLTTAVLFIAFNLWLIVSSNARQSELRKHVTFISRLSALEGDLRQFEKAIPAEEDADSKQKAREEVSALLESATEKLSELRQLAPGSSAEEPYLLVVKEQVQLLEDSHADLLQSDVATKGHMEALADYRGFQKKAIDAIKSMIQSARGQTSEISVSLAWHWNALNVSAIASCGLALAVTIALIALYLSHQKLVRARNELQEARDVLASQMEEQQNFFAVSLDLLWIARFNGSLKRVNPASLELLQYSEKELYEKSIYDLHHPEDVPVVRNHLETLIGGERQICFESRLQCKDGAHRWIEWSLVADHPRRLIYADGHDVTASHENETVLRAAKDEAESANRAKNEFLATVSHELRTPLGGILGLSDILLSTTLTEEQRENLELMKVSANTLLMVLNDLLDFSKMEAGKLELAPIHFNLRATLQDTMRMLEPRAEKKGIGLITHFSEGVGDCFFGDPDRLNQIIVNLVGNAIKFTEKGHVKLSVRQEKMAGEEICLHCVVSDTGIGMSSEQIARLFQPFTQASSGISRRYGGTGLGLSISARLVRLMKGEIRAESEEGVGSTFHFRVWLQRTTDSIEERPVSHPGLYAQTAKSFGKLNILLAEDNSINQRVARQMLERWGHKVVVAENGYEVLSHLGMEDGSPSPPEEKPEPLFDLVLMDLRMPEMDGYTALAQIRKREGNQRTRLPVIAVTAQAMKGDREKCLESGFDHYVSKPIRPRELLQAIEELFGAAATKEAQQAEQPPAQADSKHMALNSAKGLWHCEGDRALLSELAQLFLHECPKFISHLEKAVSEIDVVAITRTAHTLKSSAGYLGAEKLSSVAATMEEEGRNNTVDHFQRLLEELKNDWEELKPQIERMAHNQAEQT